MDQPVVVAAIGIVVAGIAFAVGIVFGQRQREAAARQTSKQAADLLAQAQSRREELLSAANKEATQLRQAAEQDDRDRRGRLQRREQRLNQWEENIEQRAERLEQRERVVTRESDNVEKLREQAEADAEQQRESLERVSRLSQDEAKELLLERIEAQIHQEAARRMRDAERQVQEEAEERARRIITEAIQRYAADQTVEVTQTVVPIPNDEMKGRIIGKEGRNIRALEQATGVDLIIDDTPEAVVLSSYDPIRREIARNALSKLILDGRIHPTRIEELVAKAKVEVDAHIRQEGEKAAYEASVHGLPNELIRTLGHLKFRTSYGQNVLNHSLEVALLAATMAGELHADVDICRRGGLLHDIGKAATADAEGSHALVGAEMARRHNIAPKVVHTIAAHHFEEEPQTVEAFLVAAADAISASRPGARRETTEEYIRRLSALEEVAGSFPGVERSFALQAGREIRILVTPEEVDEYAAHRLASDIVNKIEESLNYPGQIKVTVIRETRFVEYAR
ncbi:MAG: ribonuclease Y [Dehalococcoidia bacterium]|nr:ribonuclease Y [Dehalococcoidia bacterium]